MDASVKGLPFGAITSAPAFTQRLASGMSAVTTIADGPARSAIQSSATSGPAPTTTQAPATTVTTPPTITIPPITIFPTTTSTTRPATTTTSSTVP
jgi:hypothetical protein